MGSTTADITVKVHRESATSQNEATALFPTGREASPFQMAAFWLNTLFLAIPQKLFARGLERNNSRASSTGPARLESRGRSPGSQPFWLKVCTDYERSNAGQLPQADQ